MKLRLFLHRLFCRHKFGFSYNIFGDEINRHNGNRSMWVCYKCGKRKSKPNLHY